PLSRAGLLGRVVWAIFQQKLACPPRWRIFALDCRRSGYWEGGLLIVSFGLGIAVDNDVAEEIEQLGGAIATRFEFQQFGSGINQGRRGQSCAEGFVSDDIFQERNVCLDAANAEFAQSP